MASKLRVTFVFLALFVAASVQMPSDDAWKRVRRQEPEPGGEKPAAVPKGGEEPAPAGEAGAGTPKEPSPSGGGSSGGDDKDPFSSFLGSMKDSKIPGVDKFFEKVEPFTKFFSALKKN